MRSAMGWSAAALLAATATGCGGSDALFTGAGLDERHGGAEDGGGGDEGEPGGPGEVCAACKVTGGGQIEIGCDRVQFAVNAIPESGPAAGPGFEGAGIAAKGKIQFHGVPASGGGPDIDGDVDTILSCTRAGGVLTATFAGALAGGGRFEVTVMDGGEPSHDPEPVDTIELVNEIGSVGIARGNIQVHELERCEPAPPPECDGGTGADGEEDAAGPGGTGSTSGDGSAASGGGTQGDTTGSGSGGGTSAGGASGGSTGSGTGGTGGTGGGTAPGGGGTAPGGDTYVPL